MSNAQTADDIDEIALPERRDKPVTLMHRVELIIVLLLTGLFKFLGPDAASALAGNFMRHVGPLIRPVSRKAERNLAHVYPDWTQEEIRATVKDVWDNVGRTGAEFAHLKSLSDPETGRVEIVGLEKLERIKASGKPVIFITAHFANWELSSAALHRLGVDYGFVYRAANNPLTDEYIIKARGAAMSRHQTPKGKRGGRALVDMLKQGRSIALLTDQKLNTGICVPFLGKPAMTAPAPARLALKYGAPLIHMSSLRLKGAHFRLTVHDPIDFTPSGDVTADVETLTIKINEKIGDDIRAHPSQWLWFHRRWPKEDV